MSMWILIESNLVFPEMIENTAQEAFAGIGAIEPISKRHGFVQSLNDRAIH